MCTVTTIPRARGIRLACNRDESRARPTALPPRLVALGERRALLPIDPQSGGTWIAANDAGLIFTLLNVNPRPREGTPRQSRGTIIPALAVAASLAEAGDRLAALTLTDFAPFRLVMGDRSSCEERRFDGERCERNTLDARKKPLMFTSSGLGDELVDGPRRALFAGFFADAVDLVERQDAFHRHAWPELQHLSVCMSRPEARTVSLTVVDLLAEEVRLTYYPEAPDQAPTPIALSLELGD